MPELPEVETTRRGIEPHLRGRRITGLTVRQPQLRWPVSAELQTLVGAVIEQVGRRAKYLLLQTPTGVALVHLGMSGSLRLVDADAPIARHDHVDLLLDDGRCLRFTDPRRFGAWLWAGTQPERHPLLSKLGPEPLDPAFHPDDLFARSRGRQQAIKPFIMDAAIVVGVGNIYAQEALFRAGIDPRRAAGRVSQARYRLLHHAIVQVLSEAIDQGGTTLRDFVGGDGKPGYFKQELQVYGRAGEPCVHCQQPLRGVRLGQRSTVFCGHCQR